jgi:Ca2+-binding EF-hand superfamily protein
VSDKKWEEALKEADTNGDGKIDLKEFKSIFKKMMEEYKN